MHRSTTECRNACDCVRAMLADRGKLRRLHTRTRRAIVQVNPHMLERVGMWTSMTGRPGLAGEMDRSAMRVSCRRAVLHTCSCAGDLRPLQRRCRRDLEPVANSPPGLRFKGSCEEDAVSCITSPSVTTHRCSSERRVSCCVLVSAPVTQQAHHHVMPCESAEHQPRQTCDCSNHGDARLGMLAGHGGRMGLTHKWFNTLRAAASTTWMPHRSAWRSCVPG